MPIQQRILHEMLYPTMQHAQLDLPLPEIVVISVVLFSVILSYYLIRLTKIQSFLHKIVFSGMITGCRSLNSHAQNDVWNSYCFILCNVWHATFCQIVGRINFTLCSFWLSIFPLRLPVKTFVPRQPTQPTCYLTILARATSKTSPVERKARAACLTENNQSWPHQYGPHSQPDITEQPSGSATHWKTTMSWDISRHRRNGTDQQSLFSLTRSMENFWCFFLHFKEILPQKRNSLKPKKLHITWLGHRIAFRSWTLMPFVYIVTALNCLKTSGLRRSVYKYSAYSLYVASLVSSAGSIQPQCISRECNFTNKVTITSVNGRFWGAGGFRSHMTLCYRSHLVNACWSSCACF